MPAGHALSGAKRWRKVKDYFILIEDKKVYFLSQNLYALECDSMLSVIQSILNTRNNK